MSMAITFEALDDLDAINKLYRERRWSDGLPIVPPTRERVARMLACTRHKPDEVIATLAPGFGEATVERIAVNAVMAGCDPEYLPVLLAATDAVAQAQFNIQGVEATTNSAAVSTIRCSTTARSRSAPTATTAAAAPTATTTNSANIPFFSRSTRATADVFPAPFAPTRIS